MGGPRLVSKGGWQSGGGEGAWTGARRQPSMHSKRLTPFAKDEWEADGVATAGARGHCPPLPPLEPPVSLNQRRRDLVHIMSLEMATQLMSLQKLTTCQNLS
jgi:hypothetical protein